MIKKLIALFIVLVSSLFIFSNTASAKVIIQNEGVVAIEKKEMVEDDLFILGESVDISGTVQGEVFVAATNVKISGTVQGSLIVAASDVVMEGAQVQGSVIAGARTLRIDENTKIEGSLVSAVADIKNSGSIGRNLMVAAGSIYSNGSVAKEARLAAGSIELGPKTKIKGDLTYALAEEKVPLSIHNDASISGTTSRFVEGEKMREDMTRARNTLTSYNKVFMSGWMVFAFLSSLLIGSLLLYLFPVPMLSLSKYATANIGGSIMTGFIITLLILPVTLALMFTILGIPLGILLLIVYYICVHLAKLIVSFALGWFVFAMANIAKPSRYLVFLVGLLLFFVFKMIPGIGWMVSVAFTWIGLGAIYHQVFPARK